jgi:hypothetical protein
MSAEPSVDEFSDVLCGHLCDFYETPTEWYRHSPSGLLYSPGVKFFQDEAHASWLVDTILGDIYPEAESRGYSFVRIATTVFDDHSALIQADDNDGYWFWSQEHELVTLPPGDWPMWLVSGVLLLPSEYNR